MELFWIKAHAGHIGNERADTLANEASKGEIRINAVSSQAILKSRVKQKVNEAWKQ